MGDVFDKKSIIKKTFQVGSSTLVSRIFGLIREVLKGKYLGVGPAADAFTVAFMIPNSLRKIFAEGALTASFVPTIVGIVKDDDKSDANGLMSLSFLLFEGLLAFLCLLMFFCSESVVSFVASGFDASKVTYTASLFRILSSFILFISSSALLAGALQSVNHFLIPSLGPILLNLFFISALLVSLWKQLTVEYLCYAILFGGIANFLMHLWAYFYYGFSFGKITLVAKEKFVHLIKKFFPVMFSMSIMEINLLIDTRFSSYLIDGSVAIINYANRFMGIPLGVFAAAFSTILLPHFARISLRAPERLNFYCLEAIKLVFWVTIPSALFMGYFSEKIFSTLFLSDKFPMARVIEAKYVLMAFLFGLFFFSINKILLNVYYVLHDTYTPLLVSIVATVSNIFLNAIFVYLFKAAGLAFATSLSGLLQMVLFMYFLHDKYNFAFHPRNLAISFGKNLGQLICFVPLFLLAHRAMSSLLHFVLGGGVFYGMPLSVFLFEKAGYWLWTFPLFGLSIVAMYKTRNKFGVNLFFLD